MLGILVVVFSATPILNCWKVQDIKIGVAEANILIWFWCLVWNHHTPKTQQPSGSNPIFISIIFAKIFFLRAFDLSSSFIKIYWIEKIVNNNENEWRIWSWRKLCLRHVMIPMKTLKSNQNIGPRRVAFDIMNLTATQSWRSGENWSEETRVLLRVVKLCAAGNCLWAVFCKTLMHGNIYNYFKFIFLM